MSTFDRREQDFENKFAHDQELQFKARARRNKLVGQWAAEKLGLSGSAAESYASGILAADLDRPGEDSVFDEIRRDFDTKGVAQSDHQIRRTIEESMQRAIDEIRSGR